MKKFAKIAALFAVLGLALALAGCSNSSSVPPSSSPQGGPSAGESGGTGGTGNGGTGKKTAATIEFVNEYVGKTVSDGVFTNKLNNLGDGAVTYESSDTGVATVNAIGQVTIVAEGTTTIKATVADSETYEYAEKTASYILTVHPDGANIPLTIEIKSDSGYSGGRVFVQNPWSTFKYKFSNSDEFHSYTGPIDITDGVSVSFYADGSENPNTAQVNSDDCLKISCNVPCYIYGNVNSLNDSRNLFKNINDYFAFSWLFEGADKFYNHPTKDLYLPSKTAPGWCYMCMFKDCVNLERAPALPATEIRQLCYACMFEGCSKLKAAPELPATELAEWCYSCMFHNCTELESAPALPAEKLAERCYNEMFEGCSKLTAAPALPSKTMARLCYRCMFEFCTSLTTAPELPAKTLAVECYEAMFAGCSKLKKAPELPATSLALGCYGSMFYYCTELTSTPVLNAPKLEDSCYVTMFCGCSKLANVYCFATDISAENCTTNWLKGVAAKGMFLREKKMDSWPKDSASGIPTGWTEYDDY